MADKRREANAVADVAPEQRPATRFAKPTDVAARRVTSLRVQTASIALTLLTLGVLALLTIVAVAGWLLARTAATRAGFKLKA
jgi:hypothetical protein